MIKMINNQIIQGYPKKSLKACIMLKDLPIFSIQLIRKSITITIHFISKQYQWMTTKLIN